MLTFAIDALQFIFYANMALFGVMYMLVILPRLGDREIKVEYSTADVITGGYLGKQFKAYVATLSPDDRRRWHNRYMLHFAVPAQVLILVSIGLLTLARDT